MFKRLGRWKRSRLPATVHDLSDNTVISPNGAVTSIQMANLTLMDQELDQIWSANYMERLARTYWRYLNRISLGLIRVSYSEGERAIVLIARPLVLLRFHAPEYQLGERFGMVRWRIKSGVLVSRKAQSDDGYLKIDVLRPLNRTGPTSTAKVVVEVANFYPAIATGVSTHLYRFTQSKLHVAITYSFLRSLAKLDLAESQVGKLAKN